VITDNAWAYRHSTAFHRAVTDLGAQQKFIRPHCPWTNGKVERFNRTLATEWAYPRPFVDNAERSALLPAWLELYNLGRPHLGIGGRSPHQPRHQRSGSVHLGRHKARATMIPKDTPPSIRDS